MQMKKKELIDKLNRMTINGLVYGEMYVPADGNLAVMTATNICSFKGRFVIGQKKDLYIKDIAKIKTTVDKLFKNMIDVGIDDKFISFKEDNKEISFSLSDETVCQTQKANYDAACNVNVEDMLKDNYISIDISKDEVVELRKDMVNVNEDVILLEVKDKQMFVTIGDSFSTMFKKSFAVNTDKTTKVKFATEYLCDMLKDAGDIVISLKTDYPAIVKYKDGIGGVCILAPRVSDDEPDESDAKEDSE